MYLFGNERTGGIDIGGISGQRSTTERYTRGQYYTYFPYFFNYLSREATGARFLFFCRFPHLSALERVDNLLELAGHDAFDI